MTTKQTDTTDWTNSHHDAAIAEGWCVSQSEKGVQLERYDEAALFEDDAAAFAHVTTQARAGSDLHRLALRQIRDPDGPAWNPVAPKRRGRAPRTRGSVASRSFP